MGMKKLVVLIVALVLVFMANGGMAQTVATISGAPANSNVNGQYETLQAAFDAVEVANLGNVTIALAQNTTIKENGGAATLTQFAGTAVTIKGDNNTTVVNCTILITGNGGSHDDNTRVIVDGVVFDGTDVQTPYDYLIGYVEGFSNARNVTIQNCHFRDNEKNTVGIKFKQHYDLTIKGCTADGMHSLFWGTGSQSTTEFDDVTITNSGSGIHTGTIKNVVVKNSKFDVDEHAIRTDLTNAYDSNLTVSNNIIDSTTPIIIRGFGSEVINTTKQHVIDVAGNTYTALMADQADQVISYETGAVDSNVVNGEETAMDPLKNEFPDLAHADQNVISDLPQTGDTSSLMLWLAALTAAINGALLMKKRNAMN